MIHSLIKHLIKLTLALTFCSTSYAQDSVFYSGTTLSNVDYHHGQLPLAKGVHNIQVMRANRYLPDQADGFGWTYNHAPNIAYWNGSFYLQYLSDPVGEHIPPSQTYLVKSKDGYNWDMPVVAFPPYKIPDGTTKEGEEGVTKDMSAVMHQRMGFYTSKDNRLLLFGYYGICMHKKDGPNDGMGIGRVVRELNPDGSFGPIYFIRYNKGWDTKNTDYPFYKKSKDKDFVKICDEVLANPLMMQQWNEEQDRDDPIIPQHKEYKAFCYYTLTDGRIVGLWKHALFQINDNGGESWENVRRAPGFVNKNAKIWGQKTSDGKFATVYNPSEFRWPLALSVSDDGLEYKNLLLINGEITTMRYGGNYKSYGPQYVRGITEINQTPPDDNMWVTYSINKEDIWISKVPVPIEDSEKNHVNDVFNNLPDGSEINSWNIFSPKWAQVGIEKYENEKVLALHDKDSFDYAKAERLFPESTKITAEFTVIPQQNNHGELQIEFQDKNGNAATRLVFNSSGIIEIKDGYRMSKITEYEANKTYNIQANLDVKNRLIEVIINGNIKKRRMFFNPVHSLERVTFRTGAVRWFPNADTPTDQNFDATTEDQPVTEAIYYIKSLSTK